MKAITFILLCSISTNINAAVPVQGDTSQTISFASKVNATVLNQATGTLYVGTNGTQANFALAKALRNDGTIARSFQPLAQSPSPLNGKGVRALALASNTGQTVPNVALLLNTPTTSVFITNDSGTTTQELSNVKDAQANDTVNLFSLAANQHFIFTGVGKPAFGPSTNNSGIASICINQQTLALAQAPAQEGSSQIKAHKFDETSAPISIGANPTIEPQSAIPIVWDDTLQRLFVGVEVTTAAGEGNGARSVVPARVDKRGTLFLTSFAPDDAFVNGQANALIGVKNNATAPSLSILALRVMHTSTGADYLIINGGNGTKAETGNQLFALPLVNTGNPDDPTQGTEANKNTFSVTSHRFEVPAINNNDLTLNTDAHALIGMGPLPIQLNSRISDLVVDGDTVYVSLNTDQTDIQETGIFYSQAQFDNEGKIARWTPWTKRALALDAFSADIILAGNQKFDGRIDHFNVDAVNGKIWFVEGTTGQGVGITEWSDGSENSCSLVAHINKTLKNGCYTVLDLDQGTRGFTGTNAPQRRYALFGGAGRIVFAQTTKARTPNPELTTPQESIFDFTKPEIILTTDLPAAGPIRTLAYSRQNSQTTTNYFFAGSDQGLFVFTNDTGEGFNETELGDLNNPPFAGRSWHKVAAISGAVLDLKTIGNRLYILTRNSSPTNPLSSEVISVPFAPTLAAMFADATTMAQSGKEPFASVATFCALDLVSSNDGTIEQLVVATNKGIFQTQRPNGIQDPDSDITNALWTMISNTDGTLLYNDIFSIDTPNPSTVYPAGIVDTKHKNKTFNNGSLYQLSDGIEDGPATFNPIIFNPIGTTTTSTTLPIIQYYWSDGARRLFNFNYLTHESTTTLASIPFNVKKWNVLTPAPVTNRFIQEAETIYWIKQIGATGMLMVGTNYGALSLQ